MRYLAVLLCFIFTGCAVHWRQQVYKPQRAGVIEFKSKGLFAWKRREKAMTEAANFCAPGIASILSESTESVYLGSQGGVYVQNQAVTPYDSYAIYADFSSIYFLCEDAHATNLR